MEKLGSSITYRTTKASISQLSFLFLYTGRRRGSPASRFLLGLGTRKGTRFCANISIRYLYVTAVVNYLGGCCWLVEGETYLSQSESNHSISGQCYVPSFSHTAAAAVALKHFIYRIMGKNTTGWKEMTGPGIREGSTSTDSTYVRNYVFFFEETLTLFRRFWIGRLRISAVTFFYWI